MIFLGSSVFFRFSYPRTSGGGIMPFPPLSLPFLFPLPPFPPSPPAPPFPYEHLSVRVSYLCEGLLMILKRISVRLTNWNVKLKLICQIDKIETWMVEGLMKALIVHHCRVPCEIPLDLHPECTLKQPFWNWDSLGSSPKVHSLINHPATLWKLQQRIEWSKSLTPVAVP